MSEDDPQWVAKQLQGVYSRQAAVWDAGRSRRVVERDWLDRALAMTVPGDWVLDLGCGAGEPIAAHVVSAGRRVHGLDFAVPMIALARARMPDQVWSVGDMRELSLKRTFAAIIGWDSFFHLTPAAQGALIPRLSQHLITGGALLLTVGPQAGELLGEVGGEPVYHASLDPKDYAARLAAVGIAVIAFVAEDAACAGRSVLLARKVAR
jgi:SAM-dependent methyltransferase